MANTSEIEDSLPAPVKRGQTHSECQASLVVHSIHKASPVVDSSACKQRCE